MNDETHAFEAHDFFRSDRFVADPYPYFDHLRDVCPVTREPHQGIVMVTGYAEALAIYNDPAGFSSCMSTTGPFAGCPIPLEGRGNDDISALIEEYRDQTPFHDQLPTMDPPVHTAHRSLLMSLITPRRLKENEEFMWRLADQQIDTFIANGACEWMDAFAQPFAVLVVADLLGVPAADRIEFRKHLIRVEQESGGAVVGGTDGEVTHGPLEWLYGKFSTYIEERRLNPKDDVLTGLAQATFPDGSVPEPIEVARIAANVFAAGQETTVRLLSYAMQVLGDRPDIQRRLRDDRSLIPNFVEECLRMEGPVKGDFRLAKKPTTVGGVDIPAGSFLYIANSAANRDSRKFDDPGEFQLDRKNARLHLAFGAGRHACPGAPLARAETVVSLNRMFDRTSDIRISEAVHGPAGQRRYSYLPTFILRGLTHINLEFDPVEAG
ncbi:cytochrome P450 [Sphingomonas ginsenosidivorax]|uniref:Cytochrome P450 n=1 Tax=Sphingomonas ginsenosidivorax TaxID=862135 RepID=A0A5C6UBM7_9SPHN|nr:cytochrome P450 [Sphingomonas ginsenosidivorax]TXC70247.1 cytochrome P450 [Sphingomonas ginsenosidivorax]